ncbi:hypothetical protein CBI36_00855 [Acetobacter oryzifermentans]|nr:hypothetical protein CBI36_00855 [Acetobacter oryzifermentans]
MKLKQPDAKGRTWWDKPYHISEYETVFDVAYFALKQHVRCFALRVIPENLFPNDIRGISSVSDFFNT